MDDLQQRISPMIPALRRYATALLGHRMLADDIVQDCLERVITHWNQRRKDEDTRQWVFAILHNLAVSEMRRNTRRGVHIDIDQLPPDALVTPPNQEDAVRLGELLDAVNRLPEEQRSVLLLVAVEGMSYAQTAEILGVQTGTVMSRLSRARDKLAQTLDGTADAPARSPLRRVK